MATQKQQFQLEDPIDFLLKSLDSSQNSSVGGVPSDEKEFINNTQ